MIPEDNTSATADSNTNPLNLADSFLDLDSFQDWFLDVVPDFTNIMSNPVDPKSNRKSSLDAKNDILPAGSDKFDAKDGLEGKVDVLASESESVRDVCEGGDERVSDFVEKDSVKDVCEGSEVVSSVVEGSSSSSMVETEVEKTGGFECAIEEELKKVCLGGCQAESSVDVKTEETEESSESESESESDSSSSASSSSSSGTDEDDDEEDAKEGAVKVKMDEDVEDGEIKEIVKRMGGESENEDKDEDVENMVSWSDIDDEEDGGGKLSEPIRSKNEAIVLPPVPPVNVTLEPHHQLSPVGVVLSVIEAQVIVEGVEQHNPLNEASILWITESRSPLGVVDEIFGPVKNPYYVVRYNSESEIPAGIAQGTSISFVEEFADHVLNDKNLYKKGYDASGENDEELSEEIEFSDDEKEAEYRRMQKMSKRGMNDQKPANKKNNKKVRDRDMSWKNSRPPANQALPSVGQSQQRQDQPYPSGAQIVNYGNIHSSPAMGQMLAGGNGMAPTFPRVPQSDGFLPHSSGVFANAALPSPQPQSQVFPNNMFPPNGNQWPPQTSMQNPYPMPLLGGFPNPFNQPFNPNQGPLPTVAFGGPANFIPAPVGGQISPWPGVMNPNGFNPTPFGMGMQPQQNFPPINVQQGPQPPMAFPNNSGGSQNFNMGSSFDHQRKPHQRGASHFRGRGGPRPRPRPS